MVNPYATGSARYVHGVAIRVDVAGAVTATRSAVVWEVGPWRHLVVWVRPGAELVAHLAAQPTQAHLLAEARRVSAS